MPPDATVCGSMTMQQRQVLQRNCAAAPDPLSKQESALHSPKSTALRAATHPLASLWMEASVMGRKSWSYWRYQSPAASLLHPTAL